MDMPIAASSLAKEAPHFPSNRSTRACTNCVKAKARCFPSMVYEGQCKRCHRMKKDCRPSPPMRKRRTAPKQSASKVDRLEEKLDGLVTLLCSTGPTLEPANDAPRDPLSDSIELPPTHIQHGEPAARSSKNDSALWNSASVSHTDSSDAVEPGQTVLQSLVRAQMSLPFFQEPLLEPEPQLAELRLSRFRSLFVPYMPFVLIPRTTTARQLRLESPILWFVVMTVASEEFLRQSVLSRKVRESIGYEMLVKGTRTLDFLLGILVYAFWDHCYCLEKPILTSLVHNAIAVMYDLGLDKPPSEDPGVRLAYELKGSQKPPGHTRAETLDERRALLGCYLLSSVASASRKGESLLWTAYCDHCLRTLEEKREHENDALLVKLVRLRIIVDQIPDFSPFERGHEYAPTKVPAAVYLRSLQAQLEEQQRNTLCELAESRTCGVPFPEAGDERAIHQITFADNNFLVAPLLLEQHHTIFSVYEIAFSQHSDLLPNQRLKALYACLQSAKLWISTILNIPVMEYPSFTSSTYAQMTGWFVVIWRLSTCDFPEWDRTLVKESIDVSACLDSMAGRFTEVRAGIRVNADYEEQATAGFFALMAARTKNLKEMWDAVNEPSAGVYDAASLEGLTDLSSYFLENWEE